LITRFARIAWYIPNRLFLSEAREAIVDLRGLPLNAQLLAIFGYIGLFALLGLTLLLELFGDSFTAVTFLPASSDPDTQFRVPLLVMALASLAFVLGWAFLLTGATDCRRRVFFPAVALFAFQLIFLTPLEGGMTAALGCFLAVPGIGLLVAFYFLAPRWPFWRDWPIVEFIAWTLFTAFLMGILWFFNQTNAAVASSLNAAFALLLLLSVGFWVISGMLITDMAASMARWFVMPLDGLLPGSTLRALAVVVLLARPIVGGTLAVLINDPNNPIAWGLFIDVLLSLPLLLVIPVFWLLGRWDTRMAARILALGLATPVFSLGMAMAIKGEDITDLTGLLLQGVNIFPPTLLFVALNTYGALTFGSRFATEDGKIMPRTGRLYLYLGLVFLLTAFTLFFVNVQDVATGQPNSTMHDIINGAFGISAVVLGLPYLLWIAARRPERLIGDGFDEDQPVILEGLRRVPTPLWLALGMAFVLFICCAACGLLMATTPTPPS
jgi:hypothetical protein